MPLTLLLNTVHTNITHITYTRHHPQLTDLKRDFDLIEKAGAAAHDAVQPHVQSLEGLAAAINMRWEAVLYGWEAGKSVAGYCAWCFPCWHACLIRWA